MLRAGRQSNSGSRGGYHCFRWAGDRPAANHVGRSAAAGDDAAGGRQPAKGFDGEDVPSRIDVQRYQPNPRTSGDGLCIEPDYRQEAGRRRLQGPRLGPCRAKTSHFDIAIRRGLTSCAVADKREVQSIPSNAAKLSRTSVSAMSGARPARWIGRFCQAMLRGWSASTTPRKSASPGSLASKG